MKKRKVLVTGGSRGIGQALVKMLLCNGYEVCAPAHSELDLNSPESVRMFFDNRANRECDCVVNNAGINDVNYIEKITDDEIERAMNINLIAPLKIIRACVPFMKSNSYGRIVNIGSIWGVVSKSGRTVYSATKHGIHGITKTLAIELAPYNILINTVCPGFTLTDLTRKNNSNEQIAEICKEIPMQRMAEPDEIARLICFLLGSENTYLTGQSIAIDGGFTVK